MQKLSNQQSVEVIGLMDLEQHTVRDKKHQKSYQATHTFDYIVLRANHGLISCVDLAMEKTGIFMNSKAGILIAFESSTLVIITNEIFKSNDFVLDF